MMTLKQLLSRVQSDLGDVTFDKVQPAEYLDAVKDVADEAASFCRIWVSDVEVIPIPTLTWKWDTDAARLAESISPANAGEMGVVAETGKYWRVTATGQWEERNPKVCSFPANPEIAEFIMIRRNGFQAREFSFQAVTNAAEDTRTREAFHINATSFGSTEFATLKRPDGSLDTFWAIDFAEEEKVRATVITRHAYPNATWDDATVFPDFMQDTIYKGVLSRLTRRLFMQGNDAMVSRHQVADQMYEQAMLKLKSYTTRFLDRRSWMIPQPMAFLSER